MTGEITSIDTIPVEVPVKPLEEQYGIAPYSHSPEEAEAGEGTTAARKLLLRLETEGGVVGWGEIGSHKASMRIGQVIVEDLIAPALIGRSVGDVTSLFEEFSRHPNSNSGGDPSCYYRDVTPFLGCAEIAMWDALGKTLGQPVHQFLGGKRMESVPLAYCLGVLAPDASAEKARFARDVGFSVLKTKASQDWEADIERIRTMHEAVDGELEFRLDPNQTWDVQDAVRVGAELEDAGIYLQYLEQPVRLESIGTLKRMRERLETPIAAGNEDMFVPRNFYYLTREDAVDTAVPDLIPSGGILGMKREAAVAAEANVSLAHHTYFDLGLKEAARNHLIASTSAFNLAADSVYYALEDDILERPLEIEDGRMEVPDRPGLAGAIDEAKVEKYRID